MVSSTLHFFFHSKYYRSFLIPRNIFLLDTVLDSQPNQLMQNSDHLGMIDAGFFINTSSPPLLRPQREVDVIIYLSYTTGSHTSVRRILLPCLVSPFACKCPARSAQNCQFFQLFDFQLLHSPIFSIVAINIVPISSCHSWNLSCWFMNMLHYSRGHQHGLFQNDGKSIFCLMLSQAGFQTLHRNLHKDGEAISHDLSQNIKRVKWIVRGRSFLG